MKKIITLFFVLLLGLSLNVGQVSSATLTAEQVSAILNMLRAFGADDITIANVKAALTGAGVTYTPNNSGSQTSANNTSYPKEQGFCPKLYRDLYRGLSGDDVLDLQVFLRYTGDYTYPKVTGYFGPATEEAVKSYQARNGIVSSGTPFTTGYGRVGPSTRKHILNNCNKSRSDSSVAADYANLGQDFKVTPKIGSVPFVAAASFSYKGSNCTSFTLDWGDGTNPIIQYATNTQSCDDYIVKKTAKHTYTKKGTFTVKLKINRLGVSRTYTEEVNVGKVVANHFEISPTYGVAPLIVGASFVLPDSSCASYKIDWGDGNIDSEIGSASNCQTSSLRPRSIIHTYSEPGTYTVRLYIGEGEALQLVEQREVVVKESSSANFNKEIKISVSNTYGKYPLTTRVILSGEGQECLNYLIDWGDGTSPQIRQSATTNCDSQSFVKEFVHTYFIPGTYTLKIQAGKKALIDIAPEYHYVTVVEQ